MKIPLRLFVPIGFFLFAVGYLVSLVSSPATAMIGDTRGYDPGGRIVPLFMTGILAVLSLFVLTREVRQSSATVMDRGYVWLFLINVVFSAAYILFFRDVGYILATGLYLYCLIVLNLRKVDVGVTWVGAVGWLFGMLAYLLGFYTLLRIVVKSSFWLARNYSLPWAREPAIQSIAVTAVLFLAFLAVEKVLRWVCKSADLKTAIHTAVLTTMGIYIVFRMLFLVQLPAGILFW